MKNNSLAVSRMYRRMRSNKESRLKKYKRQRINRGFCDGDVWNMDSYLTSLIPAMLEELVKNPSGHPCTYKSIEEWRSVVLAIANDFRDLERLDKLSPEEAGFKDFNELSEAIVNAKNRALDGLKEVFFDLWD